MKIKILITIFLILCSVGISAAGVNVSLYSADPYPLPTNYTGILTATYIVESDSPLNYTTVAFLAGINYTIDGDKHSNIKVPANDIASEGIYRGHFRNTTPALLWANNTTLTGGNVWRWSGYDNNSAAIEKNPINSTHTWVNVTGHTSIVFPSMYYLDVKGITSAPMTGIEIDRSQGVIFKVWDVEHLRGRNNNYYINLFFDTALQDTPNDNIDLWYCNASFNPISDDPVTCQYCQRMDTWSHSRWTDHTEMQFHSNSSYAKPHTVYAGTHPDTPPDVINYIYLTSGTVASKSYILNATNYDPNICNLTYAQTTTMWLRNEISGTNTPYAYTPSFYMAFTRDYLEFDYSLHIANDNGDWGQNYTHEPIGLSNVLPTFCRYNYYWWNNTTDYNMVGTYDHSFWINLTYGIDPDNGAELTHVLSLYTNDYNFVSNINSTLSGNNSDTDIWFEMPNNLNGLYRFGITSTDNEATTSISWSHVFEVKQPHKLVDGAINFYTEMKNGFNLFMDDMGKYIVWGVIFCIVTFSFILIGAVTKMVNGGK
jgi:hypothetical protein